MHTQYGAILLGVLLLLHMGGGIRSRRHSAEEWSAEKPPAVSHERIVGGRPAVEVVPYQVQIMEIIDGEWEQFCSGAIVSARHVLTAAHCMVDIPIRRLHVLAGTIHRHDRQRNAHRVTSVQRHPRYCARRGRTLQHDFAVLTVEPEFDFKDPLVQPIRLFEGHVGAQEAVIVSGWGMVDGDMKKRLFSPTLKVLEQTTMDTTECDTIWRKRAHYTGTELYVDEAYELCTHTPSGICGADSGGPLVMRHGKQTVLIGVVSSGPPICGHGAPDIFARVSADLPFIRKALRARL